MRSRAEFHQRRGSSLALIASALVISLVIGCWPIQTLADGQSTASGASQSPVGSSADILITPSTSSSPRAIKRASQQQQQRQPLVGASGAALAANGMAPFFSIKDGKTSARRIQQQVASVGQRNGSLPIGQRGGSQSGQNLQNSQSSQSSQNSRQSELVENQRQLMSGARSSELQFQSGLDGAELDALNQLAPMSNAGEDNDDDGGRQPAQLATGSPDQRLPVEARTNSSDETQTSPIRQSNRAAEPMRKQSAGVKSASRNGSPRAPPSQQQPAQQPNSLSMSLDGMIVNSRPRASASSGGAAAELPARGVKSSQRLNNRWGQEQQAQQQQQLQKLQQGARSNSSPPPPPSTTMRSVPGDNAAQSGASSQPPLPPAAGANSRRVPFSGVPFSSPASKGQRTRPKASNQFGGFSTAPSGGQSFESQTQTAAPQVAAGANQAGLNQMAVQMGGAAAAAGGANAQSADEQDRQQQQKLAVVSLDGEPQVNMNNELMDTIMSSLNNLQQNGAQTNPVASSGLTSALGGGSAPSDAGKPDTMNRVTTTRLPNGDMLMQVISSDDDRARQVVMITRDSLDSLRNFADGSKADQQELVSSTGATSGEGLPLAGAEDSVANGEQPPTTTTTSSRTTPLTITSTPVNFATSIASTQTPSGGIGANFEATTTRTPTTTSAMTSTATAASALLDGDDQATGSGVDTFREVSIQQMNGTAADRQRDQVAGSGQVGAKKTSGQTGTKTRSKAKVSKQVAPATELSGTSQQSGGQSSVSRPKVGGGFGGQTSAKTKQKKKTNSSGGQLSTTRPQTSSSKRTKSTKANQKASPKTTGSNKTDRKQSVDEAAANFQSRQPDTTQTPAVTSTGQTNGQQLPARLPSMGLSAGPMSLREQEPARSEAGDATTAAPGSNRGSTPTTAAPSGGENSSRNSPRLQTDRGELDRQLDQMERANGPADMSYQSDELPSGDSERGRPDKTPAIGELDGLRAAIPGEPLADYPIYGEPPKAGSSFQCQAQSCPGGYYADPSSRCQVFHVCHHDGRMDTFLCPNGTIFSQQHFVCVWWWQVDCSQSAKFYALNDAIYCNSMTLPAMGGGGSSSSALGQPTAAINRNSQTRLAENGEDSNSNREDGFMFSSPRTSTSDGATVATTTPTTPISTSSRGDGDRGNLQRGPDQNLGPVNRTSESAGDNQNENDMNQQQQQQLELLSRRAA